jgi:GT2 family glycosyltransferase
MANLTAAIATVNKPEALARCLDALLSGDVLPTEVIVVDQSQNDTTQLMIERYKPSAVAMVYIRQQQCGLSASRNAAIARTSCPVLAVTDDDCVPDREWVATIDQTFASPTAPDAMTGRVLPLGPESPGLYVVSPRESTTRVEFSGKVLPWIVGTGGNFAVRREWFARIGCYDERLGAGSPGKAAEDADFLYRLLCAGARVRYEPDALIYHERQSKDRRLASRWNYGYGIGAFCSIWLRQRDLYALRILSYWFLRQSYAFVDATGRRDWGLAYQMSLSLRGTAHGVVYGWRVDKRTGEKTCNHTLCRTS